jgi:hypothetical protein
VRSLHVPWWQGAETIKLIWPRGAAAFQSTDSGGARSSLLSVVPLNLHLDQAAARRRDPAPETWCQRSVGSVVHIDGIGPAELQG